LLAELPLPVQAAQRCEMTCPACVPTSVSGCFSIKINTVFHALVVPAAPACPDLRYLNCRDNFFLLKQWVAICFYVFPGVPAKKAIRPRPVHCNVSWAQVNASESRRPRSRSVPLLPHSAAWIAPRMKRRHYACLAVAFSPHVLTRILARSWKPYSASLPLRPPRGLCTGGAAITLIKDRIRRLIIAKGAGPSRGIVYHGHCAP
jgi:hypothetical protein